MDVNVIVLLTFKTKFLIMKDPVHYMNAINFYAFSENRQRITDCSVDQQLTVIEIRYKLIQTMCYVFIKTYCKFKSVF